MGVCFLYDHDSLCVLPGANERCTAANRCTQSRLFNAGWTIISRQNDFVCALNSWRGFLPVQRNMSHDTSVPQKRHSETFPSTVITQSVSTTSSDPLVALTPAYVLQTRYSIICRHESAVVSDDSTTACPLPHAIMLSSPGTRSCSAPLSRSTGGVPSSVFRWSSRRGPSGFGLPFGWFSKPRDRRPEAPSMWHLRDTEFCLLSQSLILGSPP